MGNTPTCSMRFIVSVVVLKETGTGFNTQNKLYDITAISQEEAHGKAIPMAYGDFPEHRLHTICAYRVDPQDALPFPSPQTAG